ncbi:MAG: hypothetical protein LBJ44_09270, partial [Propionibacteriaceae bacterium]|nr:hypothetical protein [Propionibacteriaceae bacterium]
MAPAALAAWAGQWSIVWHQAGVGLVGLTAALIGLVAWRRRSAAAALVATVLAATALIGGSRLWSLEQGAVPELARQQVVATV